MGFFDFLTGSGTRTASPALLGAARNAVVGAVVAAVASGLAKSGMDPDAALQITAGVESLVGAAIAGVATLLGKLIRDWAASKGGIWSLVAKFLPLG